MPNKTLEKWEEKTLEQLGDILDSQRKPITKRDRIAGEYPYYGATGLQDMVAGYIFDEPLVLIGEDGAKWGAGDKTAYSISGKCWVNNHAHVFRPNRTYLLDNYLINYLNYIDLKPFITGATVEKLNQEKLRSIPIPVPPLSEQQRIVKILDEAFENIEKSKQNALQNLNNAKELFESYLNNILKYLENIGEFKQLSTITEVKDGTHDSPKYVKVGIPFITQKNIKEGGFNYITDDTKYITEEDHNKFYQCSNVKKNDILISMIGANRGMACIVDIDEIFSIKNVGLIKDSTNIDKYYLLYYLKSNYAKQYIAEKSKGGAQEFVGLTALRAFPILYVDVNEQQKIVAQLDELQEQTKKLEQIYEQKIKDLDELKQSILQKAFNGEL